MKGLVCLELEDQVIWQRRVSLPSLQIKSKVIIHKELLSDYYGITYGK